MKLLHALTAAAAIALATSGAGCSGKADTQAPIPRRTAYPRPQLPDTVLAAADGLPLKFEVNTQAATELPRPDWLNIRYPMLRATIHVTFTAAADSSTLDEVRRNRMQRLMLNAGDKPSNHTEFTNPDGFDVLIVETEGISTPLQFLASGPDRWVVSGAAYLDSYNAAADSLRPIIQAIRHDIYRAMQHLSR